MPSLFSQRAREQEYLDDLNCQGEAVAQNMRELKFINRWLGGDQITLRALKSIYTQIHNPQALHIMDLGCGGGDTLALMAAYGRKKKYTWQLLGVDANAFILDYARQNTQYFKEIKYQEADIFSEAFTHLQADLVTCSLFCHHFSEEQLVELFKSLKKMQVRHLLINDLHRHPLAFYSIKWLTYFFSRSYMVKHDAKLSVRRGFSRQELKAILAQANCENYTLRWRWAFRWEVLVDLG